MEPAAEPTGSQAAISIVAFRRENGLEYSREQISVSNGSKQVIFNALMATVAMADEVILPAPYYVSYPDMVQRAGGTPVPVTWVTYGYTKLITSFHKSQ